MAEPSVSLLTLNIERSKHLDRVLPFLQERLPEVCCIQELRESDIHKFEDVLGTHCIFEPLVLHDENDGVFNVIGIGLFSRLPIRETHVLYYVGNPGELRKYENRDQGFFNRVVILSDIEKGGSLFRIGTTHFSWTPDGNADEVQRKDLNAMLTLLDPFGDLILCGDFNAPRGGEIFSALSEKYTDNIPGEYTTSIDKTFHRVKDIEYMVDGVFSTKGYEVQDVRRHCGLSDHCGFTGEITR